MRLTRNASAAAVADVVRKQRDARDRHSDDGEFGKPMAANYDYGVWWNYAFARMDGFVPADSVPSPKHKKSSVAEMALTTFANRRDWQKFAEFYQDPESTGTLVGSAARRRAPSGLHRADQIYRSRRDRRPTSTNLKKAMAAAGTDEGFMCSIGPGSFARGEDLHYKTEEEFVFAAADAMREEYKAIVDAGLVLQIDDPSLPDNWDMINPGAAARGIQEIRARAHGGAQSRAARLAGRPHPLSHLLGKLARPAHHRHSAARHRRPRAERQCRRLLGRGGQRRGTSTNGASGRT